MTSRAAILTFSFRMKKVTEVSEGTIKADGVQIVPGAPSCGFVNSMVTGISCSFGEPTCGRFGLPPLPIALEAKFPGPLFGGGA